MITEPDWIAGAIRAHAELVVAMAEMMLKAGFAFDGAFLYNDMGYRNGLLFSPELYRRIVFESDQMVCGFFHRHGMPVLLHSCGGVKELIPDLIRAGFDCLQPLEVKAGMDLRELKARFGDRMAFMGGIDVRAMADADPARSRRDPQQIRGGKGRGGYIYHSDHSIPKDVSFQQYCRVMELVSRYGSY